MAVDVNQLAQQDDAYFKQAQDTRNAKQSQEALQGGQAPEPSFVSKFMTNVGRATTNTLDWAVSSADSINEWRDRAAHDVGAGIVTGATNIADAAGSAVTSSGKGLAAAEDPAHAQDAEEGSLPTSPIWDHAKSTILDFRDAIAVKDPTLSDNLLQAGAQLAVPFTGYSRMLSGVHGFANMVAASAVTDATALGPHDARLADMIALGRHTEGKFGDALHQLTPDGSALNAYISYLTDRGDETEAEGRFKNVLDGFGANMVVTPLLATVGSVLKQGTAGLRYAIENGVGSAGDLMPANQRGAVGNLAKMQAPELPVENLEPATGKTQAPDLGGSSDLNTVDRSAEHSMALADVRRQLAEIHATGTDQPVSKVISQLARGIDQTASPENLHYKKLFTQLQSTNPDAKLTTATAGAHAKDKNVYGTYDPDNHTIAIHSAAQQGEDPLLMHTIAHETTHSLTMKALADPNNKFLVRGVRDLMGEAIQTKAVQALSDQDRYAFKENKPSEFVAEALSNPRLQDALKKENLWPEVEGYVQRLMKPVGGAAVAGGITAEDWNDPEFQKFFSNILTARTPPEKT